MFLILFIDYNVNVIIDIYIYIGIIIRVCLIFIIKDIKNVYDIG